MKVSGHRSLKMFVEVCLPLVTMQLGSIFTWRNFNHVIPTQARPRTQALCSGKNTLPFWVEFSICYEFSCFITPGISGQKIRLAKLDDPTACVCWRSPGERHPSLCVQVSKLLSPFNTTLCVTVLICTDSGGKVQLELIFPIFAQSR